MLTLSGYVPNGVQPLLHFHIFAPFQELHGAHSVGMPDDGAARDRPYVTGDAMATDDHGKEGWEDKVEEVQRVAGEVTSPPQA